MNIILESTQLPPTFPITIEDQSLNPFSYNLKLTDEESKPYFSNGFRQDIELGESNQETEITLRFRGDNSKLLREILSNLVNDKT